MSSHHTLVSQREWNRMNQRIRETDAYVIRRQDEANAIQTEAAHRLQEIAAAHQANMTAIDRTVHALGNAYQSMLQQMQGHYTAQIQAQRDSFQQQISELVQQVRTVGSHISMTDHRINTLANQFNSSFQMLLDQKIGAQARATVTLQQLDNLLQQMQGLAPERFFPGEYAALVALRTAAQTNIQTGDYQSALMVSQGSILTASRLLTQLTIENEQYHRQINAARTAASAVYERMEELSAASGTISVELNGRSQDYAYSIEEWSGGKNGEFNRLRCRLSDLNSRLQTGRIKPSDLSNVRDEINQIRSQLERCDQNARQAMASTIFVENTAARLHNGLSRRGWRLVYNGHHNNQDSEPFSLQYEDGSGNAVSVVISAGESADKPHCDYEAFSDDPYRAAAIKDGVRAAMVEGGIEVGQVMQRNDCQTNMTPNRFQQNMIEEAHRRETMTQ